MSDDAKPLVECTSTPEDVAEGRFKCVVNVPLRGRSPLADLAERLDANPIPVEDGTVLCAPHVREELIAAGARPEVFGPDVALDVEGEPVLIARAPDRGTLAEVARQLYDERAATIVLPRGADVHLYLGDEELKLADVNFFRLDSQKVAEGYLGEMAAEVRLAEIKPIDVTLNVEFVAGAARALNASLERVFHRRLGQELRMLARRLRYRGGRKARSADRRLRAIVGADRFRVLPYVGWDGEVELFLRQEG